MVEDDKIGDVVGWDQKPKPLVRMLEALLEKVKSGERLKEKELSRLSFEERLWLIQRAPMGGKARLIIYSPDPMRLLKKLSTQEIYLTVKESWGSDAAIILEMTPTEKITRLLDMDIWKRDRVDFEKFMEWLQLISERGERALTKSLFSLDPPLLVLFFKNIIEVTSRNLDQDPLEFTDEGWYSLDYIYYFKPKNPEIDFDTVIQLLSRFFDMEPEYYKTIMEDVKGELPSPLEEDAYRLRSSRMAMIGFPDFYEARELLLYQSPEKLIGEIKREEGKTIYLDERQIEETPPYFLIPTNSGGVFSELLNDVAGGLPVTRDYTESDYIFWELSYLIHKLLAAWGSDLSDTQELLSSVATARDYINLGLEFTIERLPESGMRLIKEVYLQRLFRLGYSLALDVKKEGDELVNRLGKTLNPTLWGSQALNILGGLRGKRPYFYGGLEDENDSYRNFNSCEDIKATQDFFAELEIWIHLVSENITIPQGIEMILAENSSSSHWELETLFLTAFVQRCLNGKWEVIPISSVELGDFHTILKEKGEICQRVLREIYAKIDSMDEVGEEHSIKLSAKGLVMDAYDRLERELLQIDKDNLDTRFVVNLITEYYFL